jgi:DNA polymerase I-like protein with 3'-5' exonuclease and polymerase domains
MGGIRSLYGAEPGNVLVAYDKSQIEFRIAAYGSGDANMIAVCEGGDVHAMNASALFPTFDAAEYKRLSAATKLSVDEKARYKGYKALRTLAKSAVFAVCYLAEAQTVYDRIIASGTAVTMRQVEAMLNAMRTRFRTYYEWQDARLLECVRRGWTDSPILGRRRWLGHEPSPTECANFPIQSGAADVMNAEIPQVLAAVKSHCRAVRLVAHVYDSVVFEVPASQAHVIRDIALDISLKPVTITSSGTARQMVLPVDPSITERWN